ncbi:MAG TPA: acetyl-CoA carboxylase biotin carboxylase subunit, partial [Longimicrobiales bacterium]|nr:acetyl-CoA carboxylase biotin carboxylase subunit [Longimicrobiales bacterium]
VEWQFRVASGEALSFDQGDIAMEGHAIECRITAEDPGAGFLPSTGLVEYLSVPSGPGVRWDGGIVQGQEISLHYDPLLAKLIVSAADRDAAIARMTRALDELVIVGVETSAPFHRRVMQEPDFLRGSFSIEYVDEHPELSTFLPSEEELTAAAVAAALLEDEHRRCRRTTRINTDGGVRMSGWRGAAWAEGPWNRGPS